MLRLDRIRCSIQLGRYGTASSGMPACCGVRSALRELQWKQAVTTFSHVSCPPLEIGITWSRVRCGREKRSPQYRHSCASRANSAVLVSAGVGHRPRSLAWPRAAMIGGRLTTVCLPDRRDRPPCTCRQGSPRVQATAPRAYRHTASCQVIQSRTRPCASRERKRTAPPAVPQTSKPCTGTSGAPASIRPGSAVSVSIGNRAYTGFMTIWESRRRRTAGPVPARTGPGPSARAGRRRGCGRG